MIGLCGKKDERIPKRVMFVKMEETRRKRYSWYIDVWSKKRSMTDGCMELEKFC